MKFKTKILIVIIFFVLLVIMKNNSYAANVNINYKSSMIKGETQTITVSGSAVQWNLTLYVDGVAIATSRELENYEGNIAINFSAKYTPSSVGNKTIELKGSITEAADASTTTSFPSKNISVSEPPPTTTPNPEPTTPSTPSQPAEPAAPTKSSNANLKNLVVQPVDFTGFKASKTSGYSVTVENDVTKVTVVPTLADSKSSYEITGHTNLKEGTNIVKVLVIAEDGTKKTYQVNVIRKVAATEVIPNSVGDTADSTGEQNTIGLSKLEVKGFTLSTEFASNTYRYIIELDNEEILTLEQVKELISAEVNFEGGTFEITGEDTLDKEENEVIISVKDADGREIAIYTLVFKIKKVEDTSDTVAEITGIIENEKTTFDKDKIIIIASIIIISLIAIKSSITSYKQRKILQANGFIKVKEYDEEEFTEEDENRVEENNENRVEENNEIIEEEKIIESEPSEENKNDYIKDIFENNQMEFKPDDKDFVKKKRGKGKHS